MTFAALATYRSTTTKVNTPLGSLYVLIVRDAEGTIKRLMAHCGKESTGGVWCNDPKSERLSHPQVNSLLDALCHLARKLIKSGVPERIVASKLMGYDEGWPMTYTFPAGCHGAVYCVRSLQDAIAKVIVHDAEAFKHRVIMGSPDGAGAATVPPGGDAGTGETGPAPSLTSTGDQ